jgi:hypothetical protein
MKYLIYSLCFLAAGCCSRGPDYSDPPAPGRFEPDTVEVRLLTDGRKAKLLKNFTYIDYHNIRWTAPVGEEVDGASIPQVFWSIIGGPFEGKYRYASVVHDRYCHHHGGKRWQDVHRMFYEACLAGGTDEVLAKTMYAAVYHFGPRWSDQERGVEELAPLIPPERKRLADALDRAQRSARPTTPGADIAPSLTLTQEQYRELVLAPRSPQADAASLPLSVQKWDRIRAFLDQNRDASLEAIEQIE